MWICLRSTFIFSSSTIEHDDDQSVDYSASINGDSTEKGQRNNQKWNSELLAEKNNDTLNQRKVNWIGFGRSRQELMCEDRKMSINQRILFKNYANESTMHRPNETRKKNVRLQFHLMIFFDFELFCSVHSFRDKRETAAMLGHVCVCVWVFVGLIRFNSLMGSLIFWLRSKKWISWFRNRQNSFFFAFISFRPLWRHRHWLNWFRTSKL